MATYVNPVIRGMMAGIQMRNMIETARRQREELEMRRQTLEEARQERQRKAELDDLNLRLQMSNLGVRPANAEDEFRSSLANVPRFRADETGKTERVGTGVSGSDVGERMLKYRGQEYVLPTEEEKLAKIKQMLTGQTEAKLSAEEAVREKYGESFEYEPGQATTILPSERGEALQRRSQIAASNALAESRRNPQPRPTSPKLGVGTDWTSGNITPYKVTLDENGKPVILTGEPAREIARSKTGKGKTSPDKSIKFRSIETKKNTAMRAAWNTYELTKNTDPIAAQKRDISIQKAQGDYENAIVAAGGSIGPTTPRSRPPLSSFERR